MPRILTTSDSMSCQYQGSVTLAGAAKLQVGGRQALASSRLIGCTVTGCSPPSSGGIPPCTAVSTVTGGAAAKLFVGGEAVLLPSVTVQSNPGPHSVSLGPGSPAQSKLESA
jgi:hypothetical protein